MDATNNANHDLELRQQVLWTKSGHWLTLEDGTAGVEPDFCLQERAGQCDPVVPRSDKVVLPRSKYNVTVALELKTKITDSDQVEAIDYGERLLIIQHPRADSYTGVLQVCDDRADIRWVHAYHHDNEFHARITAPERLDVSGGVGQRQLLTVLSLGAADLGLCRPKAPDGFDLGMRLGEGATSIVYRADRNGIPTVLKIDNPGFERFADFEVCVLAHLASRNVFGVGECEKVGPPTAIAFPDVLEHVNVITSSHVGQLVECLKGAHKAGVVHRDVCPENILLDSSGIARLTDWGAAYMKETGIAVTEGLIGTFRYASDEVLQAAIKGEKREPKPEDDLESLVRAVLAINLVTIGIELAQLRQGDFVGARVLDNKTNCK